MTELRINGEPPVLILVLSSMSLFIASCIAFLLKRWGDVIVISFLAICATWYHSTHTHIAFYADQLSILLLTVHTILLALSTYATHLMFVIAFGYMITLYYYGKQHKCYCFHPDIVVADRFHASMHILGLIIYSLSMVFILPYEENGIFRFITP